MLISSAIFSEGLIRIISYSVYILHNWLEWKLENILTVMFEL